MVNFGTQENTNGSVMLEIHYWLQVDFHQTTHDSHQTQDETFNRHVQQTKMKFDLQQLRLTSAILNNHETELISKVTTNLFLSINQDLVCLMTPHFFKCADMKTMQDSDMINERCTYTSHGVRYQGCYECSLWTRPG